MNIQDSFQAMQVPLSIHPMSDPTCLEPFAQEVQESSIANPDMLWCHSNRGSKGKTNDDASSLVVFWPACHRAICSMAILRDPVQIRTVLVFLIE